MHISNENRTLVCGFVVVNFNLQAVCLYQKFVHWLLTFFFNVQALWIVLFVLSVTNLTDGWLSLQNLFTFINIFSHGWNIFEGRSFCWNTPFLYRKCACVLFEGGHVPWLGWHELVYGCTYSTRCTFFGNFLHLSQSLLLLFPQPLINWKRNPAKAGTFKPKMQCLKWNSMISSIPNF